MRFTTARDSQFSCPKHIRPHSLLSYLSCTWPIKDPCQDSACCSCPRGVFAASPEEKPAPDPDARGCSAHTSSHAGAARHQVTLFPVGSSKSGFLNISTALVYVISRQAKCSSDKTAYTASAKCALVYCDTRRQRLAGSAPPYAGFACRTGQEASLVCSRARSCRGEHSVRDTVNSLSETGAVHLC